MQLTQSITIQRHPITLSNGEIKTFPPITLNELDITLVDNVKTKRCLAVISHVSKSLVLWSGQDYDDIGDYTQAQAEARILELLGDNPSQVLFS